MHIIDGSRNLTHDVLRGDPVIMQQDFPVEVLERIERAGEQPGTNVHVDCPDDLVLIDLYRRQLLVLGVASAHLVEAGRDNTQQLLQVLVITLCGE